MNQPFQPSFNLTCLLNKFYFPAKRIIRIDSSSNIVHFTHRSATVPLIILTSILTRRQEFAMLQSIGMTRKQLVKMLRFEGGYYAALTAVSSVVLSIACSLLIVRPLCGQIWFTSYHFVFWPLLFVLGIFVPLIAYHTTDKQSIVERLREIE